MDHQPRAAWAQSGGVAGRGGPVLLFRGWLVVAGAFVVQMVGFGAAYSFAAFADDLAAAFGASRASVSAVYAICGFTAFATSAVSGPLSDRVGPRPLAAAGMLLVGFGLVTAATASTMAEVYLCYGAIIGLGIGFSYVPAVAAVQRWFVAWRGLASGIASAGIGFGTAIVPPAAQVLAELVDWRGAFVLSGAAAAVAGVGGALLLASSPEGRGLAPDGAAPAPAGDLPDGPVPGEVLAGREFWAVYAGVLLVSVPVSLPLAHLVRAAQDAGLPREEALALLSILGLGSIAGRFLLGAVADIAGRAATFAGCCVAVAGMTLLWAGAGSAELFMAVALGFGLAYGGFVALLPSFATDRFGRRSAASVIGVLFTGRALGLLVSVPMVAVLAQQTGGYAAGLLAAAALGLAGTALLARAAGGPGGRAPR